MQLKALKSKSVVRDWLISYICIMLIPILIGSSIYLEAMSTLKKEINRSNEGVMMQVQETIDRRLLELEKLTTEIALNKNLESLMLASEPLNDDEQYLLVNMMKDLRTLKLLNEFVDQVYIYFKKSDKILSQTNVAPGKSFFAHFRGGAPADGKYLLDSRYIHEYTPIVHDLGVSDETRAVMYARSLAPDFPDRPGAVLIFLINDSRFLSDISDIPSVSDGYVMILDDEDRVVAATKSGSELYAIPYDKLAGNSGVVYTGSASDQKAVSYSTSEITGWKYVFITPVQVFLGKLEYLKKLTYAIVALCLLIGGLTTYFFLRRNYGPIHLLLRQASDQYGFAFAPGADSNEYAFIQAALDSLAAEKNRMRLQLKEQRPAIKANLLVQLLKGRIHRSVPLNESLAALDIHFEPSCFAVMLVSIENLGKLDTPADEAQYNEKVQLVHFIISNVLEELSRRKHRAYVVEIDNMLACIINGGAKDSLQENWIAEVIGGIAEQAREFVLKHLNIHLTIAVSSRKMDMLDLPGAYEEALEATEYKVIMGGGEIIVYDAIRQAVREESILSYYYPMSSEHKLINFITAGDADQAKRMVNEIIQRNLSQPSYSVQQMKCLMAEFIGTLMKSMIETKDGKGQHANVEARIGQLMTCKNIKELQIELCSLLDIICGWNDSGGKNGMIEDVKRFVQEKYKDPNLNINIIGDRFQITPSYLAKQFKNHTGEALLEFIHKTRLEQAKRLLLNGAESIQEISKTVGFSEITTFNRTFKKYEGITPGQYREIR